MIILAIETSCDETAAAIVKDGREILSNVVASSVEIHKKTGGIIPEQAAREQVKAIIPVIHEALAEATKKLKSKKTKEQNSSSSVPLFLRSSVASIDAIGVTVGPGLIGSLLVGVETAKTLSWVWNKPLVPVNHLVGHIYANWLENKRTEKLTKLPAVALVVSGGHTDLVLLKKHGDIEWIGGTRDDAAGEAFDKTARLLGLGFPGGPSIAAAAKFPVSSDQLPVKLPRPLLGEETFDFSFSGLKTAVFREVENFRKSYISPQNPTSHLSLPTSALAYEIQEAITDVLVDKTLKAVQKYSVNTLLVAGGVAANQRLKEKFEQKILDLDLDLHIPPPRLCTDNAAMIAASAFYDYKPVLWQKVTANPGLTIAQL